MMGAEGAEVVEDKVVLVAAGRVEEVWDCVWG